MSYNTAGVYAEAYSSRSRGRISLEHSSFSRAQSNAIPIDLLLSLVLVKCLHSLAHHVAKTWLLGQGLPASALTAGVLVLASPIVIASQRPWTGSRQRKQAGPSVLAYGLVLLGEVFCLSLALNRLSVLRILMLSEYSTHWGYGLPSPGRKTSSAAANALLISVAMTGCCYLFDAVLSSEQPSMLGYLALGVHVLLAGQRGDYARQMSSDEAGSARLHSIGFAIAAAFSVPVGLYGLATLPQGAFGVRLEGPSLALSSLLPLLALVAASYFLLDPFIERSILANTPISTMVGLGLPVSVVTTLFVGFVAFGLRPGLADIIAGVVAYWCITQIVASDPRSFAAGDMHTLRPSQSFVERASSIGVQGKRTIKTILANSESRRIYYFLCLNLAFMFVQMLYGIWTNSLGLISDSIHMFFDCLALAMGLLASVMATWPSDSMYTYGFGRVETLSGFANGIFLVLISVFIVFEAVQRLLNPPEMNTNQLLVVSTLGLAVNLVGMFATGHHHHGHSHGGHDHGHSHAHGSHDHHKHEEKCDHGHDHGHGHSHDHDHDHDHGHGHDHKHDHGHDHAHEHDHGHSHGHSHSHHGHSHGHSHNMRGVFLHVMADTLGSVGVIISTLLINRYHWTGFDPLASIFIAVLIFASVLPLIQDSAALLTLDLGEEREAEVRKALHDLGSIDGLAAFAAPRFWPRDSENVVGSISIQVAPSTQDPSRLADVQQVVRRVESVLRKGIHGLSAVTIQVEAGRG